MITLKPIIEKKYYSDKIEEVIMDFLTEHFYLPIYKIIEPIEEYYNSATNRPEDVIVTALRKSEIQYNKKGILSRIKESMQQQPTPQAKPKDKK